MGVFKKLRKKLAIRARALELVKIGYFNGECPNCKEHIGTDVYKEKITRKQSARCGFCHTEMYELIKDQITKIETVEKT